MRAKEIENREGRRTFAIVFDTGDEVTNGLPAVAREHGLKGATCSPRVAGERYSA